jgi:hypothetical protein
MRLWSNAADEFEGEDNEGDEPVAPEEVRAVPQLGDDIRALQSLMASDRPVVRRVRCRKASKAYYGFGDASGLAFGATIQIGDQIWYEYGHWSSEVVEDKSSNWREFTNLVEFLEDAILRHKLAESEIFIFTDNSTSESAFWRGTSRSPLLFEFVLRLKKMEMAHNIIIHVVHVLGKRMLDPGTDGLSRLDHSAGVVTGRDMIHDWVALNQGALARSPGLSTWINRVTLGLGFTMLEPEGWFTSGHEFGNYVWAPPPAAVEVVVEQLGKARLKRPEALHLIIIPRLMTGRWRRHLGRGTDGYFKIKSCLDTWDIGVQFEPLLIFVRLPFVSANPRIKDQKQLLDELHGHLSGKDMPEIPSGQQGCLLRELLESARTICPVPGSLVPTLSSACWQDGVPHLPAV